MSAMAVPNRFVQALLAVALLTAFVAAPQSATAAPRLDPAFGHGGRTEPSYEPSYAGTGFSGATVGADGSILAIRQDGYEARSGSPVRYLADGSLDRSFKSESVEGRVEAVDSKGRTLRTSSGEEPRRIERLNPDGSVDRAFACATGEGLCGSLVSFTIEAILPLPTGKIVVAGSVVEIREGERATKEIAVARYDESGAFDPSFGKAGEVRLGEVAAVKSEELVGLALGPGEDVIVALNDEKAKEEGSPILSGGSRVVAVAGDGHLDQGFGSGGIFSSPDYLGAFEGLPDGGVLLAGERWQEKLAPNLLRRDSDIFLTRLTAAGAPDPAFGQAAGTTTVDLGGIDVAKALLRRPDGSIVVGGARTVSHLRCFFQRQPTCEETPVLEGFTANGTVDDGFGDGGALPLEALTYKAAPVATLGVKFLRDLPGGGVLAGGQTWAAGFMAEVGAGGQLAPGFGGRGIVTVTRRPKSVATAHTVDGDADGRILVLGETDAGGVGGLVPAVFRFHADGSVDRGFAHGHGFVTMPGHVDDLAVDDQGRALVLAGKYSLNSVTRVTAAGALDSHFGTEGIAPLPEHASVIVDGRKHELSVTPRTIAALPDGRVLVSAWASGELGTSRIELIELTSSGQLDRSFGHRGVVLIGLGRWGECNARSMALTHDGRIVLGGSLRAGGGRGRETAVVIRVLPDGRLDPSFGKGGVVMAPLPGQALVTAIGLGPEGEIVAGGRRYWKRKYGPRAYGPLMLRISAGGKLDRGFSRRAEQTLGSTGEEASFPAQVIFQGGRIVTDSIYSSPSLTIYSGNGQFQRSLAFGKPRHPSTSIAGAFVQRGGLVVATDTSRDRTFALSRLPRG
jgi:uncharacterized delta-60 repeat protein